MIIRADLNELKRIEKEFVAIGNELQISLNKVNDLSLKYKNKFDEYIKFIS